MGLMNLCSITNSSATDYMLETILCVYCLLFINTFYLYKIDYHPLAPQGQSPFRRLGEKNYDKSLRQSGFNYSVVDNNNNLESYNSTPTDQPNEQTNKLNP